MRRSINKEALVVSGNPTSRVSEAYRLLRTKIHFSPKDAAHQVIMVTSTRSSEGKTTTVSNLAVTYAMEGRKVLLIDADMRKPALHDIYSLSNRHGLSTVLAGDVLVQQAVQETGINHLSMLTAGPVPANPAELMDSAAMRDMLVQLRQEYDVILIDTPPVLAVSDGVITSALCDGVVMVVAAGKVKRSHLRAAKEQLDHVKANMLGLVLNRSGRDQQAFAADHYGMQAQ